MRKIYVFILLILTSGFFAKGQTKEVTTYIFDETSTIITFGSSIVDVTWLSCQEEQKFESKLGDEDIYIKRKNKDIKEGQKCQAMITLKDKTKLKLNLIYTTKEGKQTEYDLSSKKKIDALVESQNKKDDGKKKAKDDDRDGDEEEEEVVKETKKKVVEDEDESADLADGDMEVDERKAKEIDQTDEQINVLMETFKKDDKKLKAYIDTLLHNFEKYSQRIVNEKKNRTAVEAYKKDIFKEVFNNSEDASIQIQNKGVVKTYKVMEYLQRLTSLPYAKAKYNAKDIRILSFRRDPDDGKFYATISFLQEFEGCFGGSKESMRNCIKSNTKKTARVEVVVYKKLQAGKEQYTWRAFITDILANQN